MPGANDAIEDQLGRTVVAWSLVAMPDEHCVLWDLDHVVGVDDPWGIDSDRVAAIQATMTRLIADGRRKASPSIRTGYR